VDWRSAAVACYSLLFTQSKELQPMKRKVAVLLLCLFVPAILAAQSSAEKPKDTKYLTDYMKQTKQDFLKSIKGLSEAQWRFKAAPDRWSIAEAAEHITLSEDFIAGNIKDTVMKAPAPTAEQKAKLNGIEEKLIVGVTDRSKKFQAPEPLKPANKFANPKEVEKAFKEKRDANLKWAKSTPESELRAHVSPSPAGDLDAYQWLLFMAAHTKRHTLQIEEVKADLNYPKK
jgi:hypothetical protein